MRCNGATFEELENEERRSVLRSPVVEDRDGSWMIQAIGDVAFAKEPKYDARAREPFASKQLDRCAASIRPRELVPRTTPSKEYISTSETRQNIALSYKH